MDEVSCKDLTIKTAGKPEHADRQEDEGKSADNAMSLYRPTLQTQIASLWTDRHDTFLVGSSRKSLNNTALVVREGQRDLLPHLNATQLSKQNTTDAMQILE